MPPIANAMPSLGVDFASAPRIPISSCGSAYYAGLVRGWWLEIYARIPNVASEFRYRAPPLPRGRMGLLVSQSGESVDTLAALNYLRKQGQNVVSIINVPESSIARKSAAMPETVAGPKMSVASAPIIYAIPVQELVYHVAVVKGADVDQLRNLAKSAIVE
jgi:glutamine---fructose-6-phosphate transaminase (isomerizing)